MSDKEIFAHMGPPKPVKSPAKAWAEDQSKKRLAHAAHRLERELALDALLLTPLDPGAIEAVIVAHSKLKGILK